jgi:hypothetical protein
MKKINLGNIEFFSNITIALLHTTITISGITLLYTTDLWRVSLVIKLII